MLAQAERFAPETTRSISGFNTGRFCAKSLTPTPDGHIVLAHRPRIPADERFASLTFYLYPPFAILINRSNDQKPLPPL
jgi:hypothetical protein